MSRIFIDFRLRSTKRYKATTSGSSMIANYGYMDGSGQFFITIDTDKCNTCAGHECLAACPIGMFAIEIDDYDDTVATVKKEFRHTIKYSCAPCKPMHDAPPLPCVNACPGSAISHSW